MDAEEYSIAVKYAELVFGCSFTDAIKNYAGSLEKPFHHHLLVKNLYFNPGVAHLQSEYLRFQSKWQIMEQHPWELIELYRGLFLAKIDPAASEQCFSRLWEFYRNEQGISMKLLEAFARASHDIVFHKSENRVVVRTLCCIVQQALPASVPYCQKLLAYNSYQEKFFDILPFNYK